MKEIKAYKTASGQIFETYQQAQDAELEDELLAIFKGKVVQGWPDMKQHILHHREELFRVLAKALETKVNEHPEHSEARKAV